MTIIRPETEMKESGASWMGKVPCRWSISKLKWYLRRTDPRNPGSKQVLSLYREYGVIPKDSRDDNHNATSEDTSKYKYVRVGDFVVNKMKAWQGSVAVSEYEGIVSPAYYVYHFTDDSYHKRYFHYLLRSCYKEEFMRLSGGIRVGQWDLSSNDLDNILVVIPKKDEQQAIADYLDKTCSKIDEIIAEAKASIDEYKELKQSVITQTVTMNNHTKLMETGNKILPKLPISWNLVRVKNLFFNEEKPLRVGPFGSQLTTKDYLDSGYWVYTQRSVLDNNFATNDIFISDEKYEKLKAFAVKENDILITTRGSGTPGHVAKVPRNYKKGILHPCLMRFRLDEDKCLYEYLRFVFEFSTYIREQIDSASNTTAIPVLYSDTLKNLYMPLPSIEEQKEIIEKLITFEKKIDSLITEKESLINDLEAYKKSLIYEVVTGKRRVV